MIGKEEEEETEHTAIADAGIERCWKAAETYAQFAGHMQLVLSDAVSALEALVKEAGARMKNSDVKNEIKMKSLFFTRPLDRVRLFFWFNLQQSFILLVPRFQVGGKEHGARHDLSLGGAGW